MDLALADPAAIVRYWAARAHYFSETEPDFPAESGDSPSASKAPPSEEVARATAARNDSSELVRLSVDRLGPFSGDSLTEMPQLQRLMVIRNESSYYFPSFMAWLGKAVEAGVPDVELYECALEFFGRPDVSEELREDDFDDGDTAYIEGKATEAGWELLKGKAGRLLGTHLVYLLPARRGLSSITAEDLAALPEHLLDAVLDRRAEHPTFAELANMVREQPDRFPESVVESLARDEESYRTMPDEEERTVYRWKHAVDRPAAAMDALLSIRKELERLHERVAEVVEVAGRRRGIFG